jgi:hypothetical protein
MMANALKGAAFVIALLSSNEKVSLVCDGTTTINGFLERPASMSAMIDLDAGTMETSLGILTIAKTTDRELQLEKLSETGGPFRSEIDAKFDRISGHLVVSDWRNGLGGLRLQEYDLTCKKTAPVL